ncbi:MAG: prepilin-type N-terminal cleavage/methylation domain-containing protein [Planctomycetota bacterium]|nr:prepilin-type N-terminal cleavage/methylation domain-containing protein [Planctomycetota bacterium]
MNARRGFTLTELMVVIGIIVVLLGLLLPALAGVFSSGLMTKSMSNMRQIGRWMRMYSSDNREFIVPSQFNYSYPDCPTCYRGKVRSAADPPLGDQHKGTWSDILWTVFEGGVFPEAGVPVANGGLDYDYRFDSPDKKLYDLVGGDLENPFRSAALNKRNAPAGGGTGPAPIGDADPTPFGSGAQEIGRPGYFAANNFFDSRDPDEGGNGWFSTGQIKAPERSMYLVDSVAGETIEDEPEPFQAGPTLGTPGSVPTLEVDFRYSGVCLMLFLDGHTEPVGQWQDICELEGLDGRSIRIRNLTSNVSPCPAP